MMKKKLLRYLIIFIFGIIIPTGNVQKSFAFEFHNEQGRLIIRPGIGYRMDNLDWNIAGDNSGQNPNILSELEFNDIKIFQAGLDANLVFKRIYLRGSIYYGHIMDGECIDSDYNQDNRNGLYSRSVSELKGDNVQDISVCMGYQFEFFNNKLTIAPLIGLSYHEQNINMTNGVQTVGTANLQGLDSTYETEWKSSWLGMDILFEIITGLFLSSTIEYHIADYEAKANWNLRKDFEHPLSFIHDADGEGTVVKIGINKILAKNWNIGLMYSWQDWSTDEGVDRVFLASGVTSTTKLNKVNWNSQSIGLSFSYKF